MIGRPPQVPDSEAPLDEWPTWFRALPPRYRNLVWNTTQALIEIAIQLDGVAAILDSGPGLDDLPPEAHEAVRADLVECAIPAVLASFSTVLFVATDNDRDAPADLAAERLYHVVDDAVARYSAHPSPGT